MESPPPPPPLARPWRKQSKAQNPWERHGEEQRQQVPEESAGKWCSPSPSLGLSCSRNIQGSPSSEQ